MNFFHASLDGFGNLSSVACSCLARSTAPAGPTTSVTSACWLVPLLDPLAFTRAREARSDQGLSALGPASASKHFHLPLPRVVSIPFPALPTSIPAYSAKHGDIDTISSAPLPSSTVTANASGGQGDQPLLPPLPGSGLLSSLLLKLDLAGEPTTENQPSVATGCVLAYSIEGDNRSDAFSMAQVLDRVLDLGVGRAGAGGWREPDSWDALVRGAKQSEWA